MGGRGHGSGCPRLGPAIAGELAQACREALNLAHGQLHPALPMQVVSTGLPYLIVPVQGGLDSARVSHPGFEALLAASGAKFAYVLDRDRPEGRTWDNAGRVEDVATGHLLHHASVPPGNPCWSTRAVHRRPSTIEVHPGWDGRLWVDGPVAPGAAGRLHAHLT